MKRTSVITMIALSIAVCVCLLISTVALADKPVKVDSQGNEVAWEQSVQDGCVRIQDGTLTYLPGRYMAGEPLETGFDPYGYNYQGHMFKGSYYNSYANGAGFAPYLGEGEEYDAAYLTANPNADEHWAWPYRDVQLLMKWNDAWLANTDCDADGELDRYYGFDSYIGSGAWLTNHQSGTYEMDGKTCSWNYFTKIVAAPADAVLDNGVWYTADGVEIGPSIWGAFATIQEVSNDQCDPDYKYSWNADAPTGFGYYMP